MFAEDFAGCEVFGSGKQPVRDIRDRVAEAIEVDDFAFDAISPPARLRPIQLFKGFRCRAEFVERLSAAQVSRHGRKNIAPVEGAAQRLEDEFFVLQAANRDDFLACQRERQEAVSGPTKKPSGVWTAMALRALPTPGSTTATWMVPRGKKRHAAARAKAAPRMSPAGISWVRSTRVAWGLRRRMTPFMVPANQSRVPKSVVRVITAIGFKPSSTRWFLPVALLTAGDVPFEAGELFEQRGAIGVNKMRGQVTLVRAGEDGGEFLHPEQFRVERIDEGADGLFNIGALNVVIPFLQDRSFLGADED